MTQGIDMTAGQNAAATVELENRLIGDDEYRQALSVVRAGSMVSFNWMSFLGPYWLIYRKCYIVGWSIFFGSLFSGFLFGTNIGMALGVTLISMIVLGLFGNAIYYSDIKRRVRIANAIASEVDREKYIEANSGVKMSIGLIVAIGLNVIMLISLFVILNEIAKAARMFS